MPNAPAESLLREHHAFVPTDNAFQRRARLLQARWRERQGLAIGEHRGAPLGSRLVMPDAEERLTNYLTDGIRAVVRREVLDPTKRGDRLLGKPRIFNDLLSSQPLCFNLFGELERDLPLATRAFADLTAGRAEHVTAIEFEHSPGRGDARYTGDRSAFDVFVEYRRGPVRGFLGIEVKYHEGLGDPASKHHPRYDEIAAKCGHFAADALDRLKEPPLQQIWRDHLLAQSIVQARDYDEGSFVFLHPRDNENCARAVVAYRACLADTTDPPPFAAWTLEQVTAAIRSAGAGPWIDAFEERYLAFDRSEDAP